MRLEVGSSTTTVEVSGCAPPVDTTSAQLGTTYDSQMSSDLGLTGTGGQGAGVLNLSMLSPGVSNANAMGDGMGPSVGGQRPRDNNFTVEGVDNNNKSVTGALISIPNDAVENFTLLENQFNAEFGHSSGGQFNTTIKTGTNGFHGSLYEYFRNRNLNAIDQTFVQQGLTSNPRLDSNRYGATFGGPIIKNKLFFFTLFERQPIGLTGTAPGTVDTPTSDGLATIAADDPNVSATNFTVFKQYAPVAPTQAQTCLPNTTANPKGSTQVGQGSQPCFLNFGTLAAPIAVNIGGVSIVPPAYLNYENFVQSVDLNLSEKDQVRGRYVFNNLEGPDVAAQLPAFYINVPTKFRLFTIGEYHTFSPSILNEFRVGFNRYANTTPVGSQSYPGLDAFPNIVLDDEGAGLNIGPDPNAPQYTIQNYYSAVDNVSWTKGKHTLKFGVEWAEYISPQNFTQRARGDYEYNETQTFLEDISPDIIGQRSSGSTTYYGNQSAFYWYANDTWRVTPHLTLNLGVRYEYTTIPLGEQRQSLNTISNSPNLIVSQVNEPLIFSAPRAPKNDYAPRIGIAYSPGSDGTTSIRAGFGMAYDTLYDNIGILAVPPQVGATNNVDESKPPIPNFLGGGGLAGGGSGVTVLDQETAVTSTSSWVPPDTKYPYSINWNIGVQHSFGKNYTAEVGYVGTRGNRLDVQNILNYVSPLTASYNLPTYLQAPSQATLDALPNNLNYGLNFNNVAPAYANLYTDPVTGDPYGFGNPGFTPLTGFIPEGWSTYHGLQTQLTRRFSHGLQLQAAWTWSHTIDDSTADFHSTDLTPRRQQDFYNSDSEKATSALSRTHRVTIAAVYSLPYFKSGNWLTKNVLGNWEFSPVYTYESPEFVTVQSAIDSNLNGDSAGDRAIFNPSGTPGTGSGIIPLCNSTLPAGDTCDPFGTPSSVVAYQAVNPNAQYIQAGYGAVADTHRNTLPTVPTNNFDLAVYKDLNFTERFKLRLGASVCELPQPSAVHSGQQPWSWTWELTTLLGTAHAAPLLPIETLLLPAIRPLTIQRPRSAAMREPSGSLLR